MILKTAVSTSGAIAYPLKYKKTRTSFQIVHLSDLHLTKTDKASRSEPALFRPLAGMNEAFRKIVRTPVVQSADLVLITGDVTDRGDIISWRVFWDIIDAAGLRDRVLIVPGNHDVCCLGLRLPTKRKGYRYSDLEKAKAGLKMGGQPAEFPWVRIVHPQIAVFGLNSNNLGNFSVVDNAMGQLDYNQLAKLARLLNKYQTVPVKIVALHHSPNIPDEETAKGRGIEPLSWLATQGHQVPKDKREALRLLCIAHHVRLVLHGHLHRAEDRRVDSVRMVGVGATTEPIDGNAGQIMYAIKTYIVRGAGGRVDRRDHQVVCG